MINVSLSNTLRKIRDNTFWRCSSLKSITIPESIECIGSFSFCGCTALEEVIFKDNDDNECVIEDCAFYDCISLTNIMFPDRVTYIGDDAFKGCKNLTEVTLKSYAYTNKNTFNGAPIDLKINIIDESDDEANYPW